MIFPLGTHETRLSYLRPHHAYILTMSFAFTVTVNKLYFHLGRNAMEEGIELFSSCYSTYLPVLFSIDISFACFICQKAGKEELINYVLFKSWKIYTKENSSNQKHGCEGD
jgi:hypothetical protein